MYFVSESQGHWQSSSPGPRGIPTLWTAGTNSPDLTTSSRAAMPMRVMIRMFTTTYGESVISTPRRPIGEPTGPIENGMTYIVRPRMQPVKSSLSVARISTGSRQLLVGPASSSRSEQMKVRSSTRATSEGSERARKLLGRSSGLRRMNVPDSTRCWQSFSFSASEPSHQWIASGVVRVAISSTQRTSGCDSDRPCGCPTTAPMLVTVSPRANPDVTRVAA